MVTWRTTWVPLGRAQVWLSGLTTASTVPSSRPKLLVRAPPKVAAQSLALSTGAPPPPPLPPPDSPEELGACVEDPALPAVFLPDGLVGPLDARGIVHDRRGGVDPVAAHLAPGVAGGHADLGVAPDALDLVRGAVGDDDDLA